MLMGKKENLFLLRKIGSEIFDCSIIKFKEANQSEELKV